MAIAKIAILTKAAVITVFLSMIFKFFFMILVYKVMYITKYFEKKSKNNS